MLPLMGHCCLAHHTDPLNEVHKSQLGQIFHNRSKRRSIIICMTNSIMKPFAFLPNLHNTSLNCACLPLFPCFRRVTIVGNTVGCKFCCFSKSLPAELARTRHVIQSDCLQLLLQCLQNVVAKSEEAATAVSYSHLRTAPQSPSNALITEFFWSWKFVMSACVCFLIDTSLSLFPMQCGLLLSSLP